MKFMSIKNEKVVNKGILKSYGSLGSCITGFVIDGNDSLFSKTKRLIKSADDLVYEPGETYWLMNNSDAIQVSITDVAKEQEKPFFERAINNLIEELGDEVYTVTLKEAAVGQDFDSIFKSLVTTVNGPSKSLIPVLWYFVREPEPVPNFTEEVAKEIISGLEEQFPAVDLEEHPEKRFVEVLIHNVTMVFNRNHSAFNGRTSSLYMMRNLIFGMFDSMKGSIKCNEFGRMFLEGANDIDEMYWVYTGEDSVATNGEFVNTGAIIKDKKQAEEEQKKTWEEPSIEEVKEDDIKGEGPLPMLDKMTKHAKRTTE